MNATMFEVKLCINFNNTCQLIWLATIIIELILNTHALVHNTLIELDVGVKRIVKEINVRTKHQQNALYKSPILTLPNLAETEVMTVAIILIQTMDMTHDIGSVS